MRKLTRVSLEKFLAANASDAEVLDIGSGGSGYGRYFPNRITLDVDPARNPQVIGDAHELPFEDGRFAVILCTEVLEHLSNPPKAISEMHRVLAPGGKLILSTRFLYPLHDVPHDYYRYTEFGLRHLFREWKEVTILPEASTFRTLGILLQRIILQTEVRGGKVTKALLLALAYLCTRLDWLTKAEYGDIGRTRKVHEILSSGYYVTARK
ncbi:MAG TPA: class I SAM-dependent methyltransferase [Candidatus Paceibacterota bacterium]|nr:class I SAM-dependent methyltransferase [Candidatus Paceibacterota bacterium]